MTIQHMDNIGIVVDDLLGEVTRHEDSYLLCYLRGPSGIILAGRAAEPRTEG